MAHAMLSHLLEHSRAYMLLRMELPMEFLTFLNNKLLIALKVMETAVAMVV